MKDHILCKSCGVEPNIMSGYCFDCLEENCERPVGVPATSRIIGRARMNKKGRERARKHARQLEIED